MTTLFLSTTALALSGALGLFLFWGCEPTPGAAPGSDTETGVLDHEALPSAYSSGSRSSRASACSW